MVIIIYLICEEARAGGDRSAGYVLRVSSPSVEIP